MCLGSSNGEVVIRDFTEELWIQNIRITWPTFEELCNAVTHLAALFASCPREPVPADKPIVIAICKMATSAEYRDV